jgi:hypothetical protein
VAAGADRLVVGAPDDDDDENHAPAWSGVGSASVFRRTGNVWEFEQRLWEGYQSPGFGYSVALSGETLAVAIDSITNNNGVVVFVRNGSSWAVEARLHDPDSSTIGGTNHFGSALALDGDVLVTGSPEDDGTTNSYSNSGAVYLYGRTGTTWALERMYRGQSDGAQAGLGRAVALSGNTAAAAARGARVVRIFLRSGMTWSEQGPVVPYLGETGDNFGSRIALSGDTLAVASDNDNDSGVTAGAITIYTRSGGTWTYQQKLLPSNPVAGLGFGRSLALSGDRLIVSTSNPSRVYTFERSNGVFAEAQVLTPWSSTIRTYNWSVALAGDTAVVGVPFDVQQATGAGAAYVYRFTDPLPAGSPCSVGEACASGFCVDAVCCNVACAGAAGDCQACSVAAGAAVEGVCGPRSDGSSCNDGVACNGADQCSSGACTTHATTCGAGGAGSGGQAGAGAGGANGGAGTGAGGTTGGAGLGGTGTGGTTGGAGLGGAGTGGTTGGAGLGGTGTGGTTGGAGAGGASAGGTTGGAGLGGAGAGAGTGGMDAGSGGMSTGGMSTGGMSTGGMSAGGTGGAGAMSAGGTSFGTGGSGASGAAGDTGEAGEGGAGGEAGEGAGGSGARGGSGGDAGASGSSGSAATGGSVGGGSGAQGGTTTTTGPGGSTEDSGCSCRTAGASTTATQSGWLLALLLGATRRLRRIRAAPRISHRGKP